MAYFKRVLHLTTMAMALASTLAMAEVVSNSGGTTFGDKEQGWFWYKDDAPKKPKVKPTPTPPPPSVNKDTPKTDENTPLTVAWLKKNADRLRDNAIENPTDENIRAYMYVQRVILDKSQNFAEAARRVVANDPFLDENNRVPINAMQRQVLDRDISRAGTELIANEITQKAGLWFFFNSTCKWCHEQHRINKILKERYPNLTIMAISVDKKKLEGMDGTWYPDRGQAKMLQIEMTPAMVLVSPPNNFSVISQGVDSVDILEEKIVNAAKNSKLISEKSLARLQAYDKGVLTTKDLQDPSLKAIDQNDMKKMVEIINKNMRSRYND